MNRRRPKSKRSGFPRERADNSPPTLRRTHYAGSDIELRPELPSYIQQHYSGLPLGQSAREYFVKWTYTPELGRSVNGSSFGCSFTKPPGRLDLGDFDCTQAISRPVSLSKRDGTLLLKGLQVDLDSGKCRQKVAGNIQISSRDIRTGQDLDFRLDL